MVCRAAYRTMHRIYCIYFKQKDTDGKSWISQEKFPFGKIYFEFQVDSWILFSDLSEKYTLFVFKCIFYWSIFEVVQSLSHVCLFMLPHIYLRYVLEASAMNCMTRYLYMLLCTTCQQMVVNFTSSKFFEAEVAKRCQQCSINAMFALLYVPFF